MYSLFIHPYDSRLSDDSAPPEGHPMLKMIITACHTDLDAFFGKYDHLLSSLEVFTVYKVDSRISENVGFHFQMHFIGPYNGSFHKLEAFVSGWNWLGRLRLYKCFLLSNIL
jgi:hypothetical protein